jgi:MFS-type transporter involved in bile tolerance (Atg22 family)
MGMKKAMLICFAGCFVFSVVLFNLNPRLTVLTYVEMAVIALFVGISQGVLNAYIPALFPVHIRSAATGFCFNIGRIFTASAVFFVGWLVNFFRGYGNALTVFSFVFLVGFLVCVMVKEKKFIQ